MGRIDGESRFRISVHSSDRGWPCHMKEPDPIVFVIDDDALIRDGIHSLIKTIGLRAQTFASAQDFMLAKRPDAPSCLILDVRMPGLNGLDLQSQLNAAGISHPNHLHNRSRRHSDVGASHERRRNGVLDQAGSRPGSCWMLFRKQSLATANYAKTEWNWMRFANDSTLSRRAKPKC